MSSTRNMNTQEKVDTNLVIKKLEKELHQAIQLDERYKLQNEAKFRAVNQNVGTYEEFREIVNAAHLQPLDKSSKIIQKSKTQWNPLVSKSKISAESHIPCDTTVQITTKSTPNTAQEFMQLWQKCPSDEDKLQVMKSVGDQRLAFILASDITFGWIGEIMKCLLQSEDTIDDYDFVVQVLVSLSKIKRFGLALQFMTADERKHCKELFQLLKLRMGDKLQDLAEREITEWTLQELEGKYEVNTL